MENHQSNYRSFNFLLEGQTVATGVANLARGAWVKYVYDITVADGELSVTVQKITGDPHLMGVCSAVYHCLLL